MIEILLQHKWLLLVLAEALAWITTITMFLARYWWESKAGFWISFILSIVTGIGIQLCIAFINIIKGQNLGLFEVAVILLILYGSTYGKKQIKSLDQKIMTWSNQKRALH